MAPALLSRLVIVNGLVMMSSSRSIQSVLGIQTNLSDFERRQEIFMFEALFKISWSVFWYHMLSAVVPCLLVELKPKIFAILNSIPWREGIGLALTGTIDHTIWNPTKQSISLPTFAEDILKLKDYSVDSVALYLLDRAAVCESSESLS